MKKLLFSLSLLSFSALPIASVACIDLTGGNQYKIAKPYVVTKFDEFLKEQNITLDPKYKEKLDNFTNEDLTKLRSKLATLKDTVLKIKKENEGTQKPEFTASLEQMSQLLSENIYIFLKYIYYFSTVFYDYGLLSFNFEDDSKPKHSDEYLHYSINQVNSFSETNATSGHTHYTYMTNEIKPVGNMWPTSFSNVTESRIKPGYYEFYVAFSNIVYKFYVKEESGVSQIIMDPICFAFKSSLGQIDAQQIEELYNINLEELELDRANQILRTFENTTQRELKFPQRNIIF
ncbi:hypothetical protein [Mycoplasma sp. 2248]|uniref:hypothetical protein n=1 Tax=Mycoplasma sp. 2248 TaxID=3108528 RepID=UPI002B1DC283|nr:hypothetical protein [Mycoplasma sp. 2248]MEA4191238.1 hypothetical protein [Mycoplasma sp. 2248]